jgi:signal transduction histidine kinase
MYLTDIVLLVNNIVGIFVMVRFLNHILLRKNMKETNRRWGLATILVIATLLNIKFENLASNLLLGLILNYFIGEIFYIGKRHVKLVAAIFFVVFSVVTELLTAVGFGLIFDASVQGVRENIMHLFLGGIVSKIMLILLMEIVIKFRRRNASAVSLSSWLLIISIPVISIALAILVVYEPVINNSFSNIAVFACLAIIYIDLIAFYLFDSIVMQIDENNNVRFREKQLLIQQHQHENIISTYKQIKKLRHDMLGHLITIDGYLTEHRVDEAKSYIGKLHDEIDFTRQGIYSENVGVDAIINNRRAKADDLGIETSFNVMIPGSFRIDDMDLCVILGNLLTNAIEACQRIDDRSPKYIHFKMRYKREMILIDIKNAYNAKTINTKKGKFLSSKPSRSKNEMGMGLENIDAVIKKYGGVFEMDLTENEFVVKLVIPDKKI